MVNQIECIAINLKRIMVKICTTQVLSTCKTFRGLKN